MRARTACSCTRACDGMGAVEKARAKSFRYHGGMNALDVSLGPLGAKLVREAAWAGKDAYPAWPEYGTELEALLQFLARHGQLARFWPRLSTPRTHERDETLQEIRVAYYLHDRGFPIIDGGIWRRGRPCIWTTRFWTAREGTFAQTSMKTWAASRSSQQPSMGGDWSISLLSIGTRRRFRRQECPAL